MRVEKDRDSWELAKWVGLLIAIILPLILTAGLSKYVLLTLVGTVVAVPAIFMYLTLRTSQQHEEGEGRPEAPSTASYSSKRSWFRATRDSERESTLKSKKDLASSSRNADGFRANGDINISKFTISVNSSAQQIAEVWEQAQPKDPETSEKDTLVPKIWSKYNSQEFHSSIECRKKASAEVADLIILGLWKYEELSKKYNFEAKEIKKPPVVEKPIVSNPPVEEKPTAGLFKASNPVQTSPTPSLFEAKATGRANEFQPMFNPQQIKPSLPTIAEKPEFKEEQNPQARGMIFESFAPAFSFNTTPTQPAPVQPSTAGFSTQSRDSMPLKPAEKLPSPAGQSKQDGKHSKDTKISDKTRTFFQDLSKEISGLTERNTLSDKDLIDAQTTLTRVTNAISSELDLDFFKRTKDLIFELDSRKDDSDRYILFCKTLVYNYITECVEKIDQDRVRIVGCCSPRCTRLSGCSWSESTTHSSWSC